ncbi:MAG TPA: hypothetical protein VK543_04390, partial [Puia sp.]|nr:hypothetical protein [Puia sp.]
MRKKWTIHFFSLLFITAMHAQDHAIAFKGALIYPVTGEAIPDGVLIVQKGKIISIDKSGTAIPAD